MQKIQNKKQKHKTSKIKLTEQPQISSQLKRGILRANLKMPIFGSPLWAEVSQEQRS